MILVQQTPKDQLSDLRLPFPRNQTPAGYLSLGLGRRRKACWSKGRKNRAGADSARRPRRPSREASAQAQKRGGGRPSDGEGGASWECACALRALAGGPAVPGASCRSLRCCRPTCPANPASSLDCAQAGDVRRAGEGAKMPVRRGAQLQAWPPHPSGLAGGAAVAMEARGGMGPAGGSRARPPGSLLHAARRACTACKKAPCGEDALARSLSLPCSPAHRWEGRRACTRGAPADVPHPGVDWAGLGCPRLLAYFSPKGGRIGGLLVLPVPGLELSFLSWPPEQWPPEVSLCANALGSGWVHAGRLWLAGLRLRASPSLIWAHAKPLRAAASSLLLGRPLTN